MNPLPRHLTVQDSQDDYERKDAGVREHVWYFESGGDGDTFLWGGVRCGFAAVKRLGQYVAPPILENEMNYGNQISAVGAVSERQLSELQERANILAKEFEGLACVLNDLEHRLTAFMRPDDTTVKDQPNHPVPAIHSPMWHELNTAIGRVEEVRIRLQRICNRVEN